MKLVYFGGPMDGEVFDTAAQTLWSGIMLQGTSEGDLYIPIQIGMLGGSYVPDYGVKPPRLVWKQQQ